MKYIIIIGVFQSLMALMLLMTGQKRRPVHHLLFWLLACLCTHLSIKFVIYAGTDNEVLQKGFNTFIDLAYGPLLWMVARKVQNDRYIAARHWYLFVPAIAAATAFISITLYMLVTGKVPMQQINLYNEVTVYFILVSFLVFPVLAYRIAKNLAGFWGTEKKLLLYLSGLFFCMGLISVTVKIAFFFDGFAAMADTVSLWLRIVAYSVLALESILIGRYLFRLQTELTVTIPENKIQPAIVQQDLPAVIPVEEKPEEKIVTGFTVVNVRDVNIKTTNLPAGQQQEVMGQLEKLMKEKKVYTDPDLSLEKLSALAKIPKHHITESLHRHGGSSFYQFVNTHRVQEMIRVMDKCRRQGIAPSILSLAYEAGFNSKSTFNHYFKQIIGLTPSEYLKKGSLQSTQSIKPMVKDSVFMDFAPPGTVG